MAIDIKKPAKKEQEEDDLISDIDPGETLMEWKISEYEEHSRGKIWYIIVAVISAGFLISAIVTLNFLFALIVIIVDLIILIQTTRKPSKLNFRITEEGLIIGNTFHSYRNINRFWIVYDPPKSKTLYFSFSFRNNFFKVSKCC